MDMTRTRRFSSYDRVSKNQIIYLPEHLFLMDTLIRVESGLATTLSMKILIQALFYRKTESIDFSYYGARVSTERNYR